MENCSKCNAEINKRVIGSLAKGPFQKLRSFLLLEKDLHERMDKLESDTNKVFKVVFERLDLIEEVVDTKLPRTKRKIDLKN